MMLSLPHYYRGMLYSSVSELVAYVWRALCVITCSVHVPFNTLYRIRSKKALLTLRLPNIVTAASCSGM